MPALLAIVSPASVVNVIARIVRVRTSLATLHTLASKAPQRLLWVLRAQRIAVGTREPRLIFLDIETPLCYALMIGMTVLISRGFIDGLNPDELAIVVRPELVHGAQRGPLRGFCWHLAFAAPLVPGFDYIERWLYDRRERCATALAGTLADKTRFDEFARRVLGSELASERSLGTVYAGALRPRTAHTNPRAAVLVALFASHWIFSKTMPVLERHHC